MRKSIFLAVPILLLVIFYFRPQRQLRSEFRRVFNTKTVRVVDTIPVGGLVDGISIDNGNLYINQRFSFVRLNKKHEITGKFPAKNQDHQSPVVNFYVLNDSLYYYQANGKAIHLVDLKDNTWRDFNFNFPITYFARLKNNSFLFVENVLGGGGIRLHYKAYDSPTQHIDTSAFSSDTSAGMKFSGNWISSARNEAFFIPFYDDNILCFTSGGNLKYKIKAVDWQNQPLDVIKEGSRYYLTPEARLLRLGSGIHNNKLFISSFVRTSNQSAGEFENNLTIDVYDVATGTYLFTFYIPNFKEKKATDFAISNGKLLYAVYNSQIVVYDLSTFLHEN